MVKVKKKKKKDELAIKNAWTTLGTRRKTKTRLKKTIHRKLKI